MALSWRDAYRMQREPDELPDIAEPTDDSADEFPESRYHIHDGCNHSCVGFACTFTRTISSLCVNCQIKLAGL